MSAPLRVGVVGLGKIAQLHHLPNLVMHPGFEVAALCDLSLDLAKRLADQLGAGHPRVSVDVDDVLEGLDALVVTNRHHAPVLLAALDAGVPVFVEKPACWTPAELDAIADARHAATPLVVGYMKRYDPAVQEFLALEAGQDAPRLSVRVHNFAGGRHKVEPLHDVLKPSDLPLGPGENEVIDAAALDLLDGDQSRAEIYRMLMELAIHDVNLLGALLGPLTLESAVARRTQVGWLVGFVASGGGAHVSLEIAPDFANSRDWDETLTVYRSAGQHELRFGSPFLREERTVRERTDCDGVRAVTSSTLLSRRSGFERELDHFHDVVTAGTPALTSLPDARRDQDLVLRVARTAEVIS